MTETKAFGDGVSDVVGERAEKDAGLLTRWDVPCPTCKAQPGQPCRRPNGDKVTNFYGRPDFHAARKGRVTPPERATL